MATDESELIVTLCCDAPETLCCGLMGVVIHLLFCIA
jgi:hypothetical protein